MTVFKCKMCGGALTITEGSTVCECEFCGTLQTVPNADNEKKMNLFARANRLRFNNEFDKASGVYESIIADFPEEAEAYWGLVLCKYGIEYVEDPATGKKVPTCHRSSFDSVFDDNNYELVMEYADTVSKRVYREEAKCIEELRKSIIEVSSNEKPYDIFICYKETDENGERTLDSVLAQDIYDALTEKGYRVFFSRITLEDKLGVEYEPYIFAALHSAKVMLAVGTNYEYYDAVWVKNEWSRYLQLIAKGEKKTLIPVYKNLDAYDMPKEFARLQAQDMGKVGAMQDLLRGIDKITGRSLQTVQKNQDKDDGLASVNIQVKSLVNRGYMALEKKDFYKARDFFEEAISFDAENGPAYWGLVLFSKKAETTKNLAGILLYEIRSNKEAGEKTVLTFDLTEAAKEADIQGLLSYFTEDELKDILSDFEQKPITYTDKQKYYQEKINYYHSIDGMSELINSNHNKHSKYFERAYSFKDTFVENEMKQLTDLLDRYLSEELSKEKDIAEAAEAQLQNRIDEFKKYVAGKVDSVSAEVLKLIEEHEKDPHLYESRMLEKTKLDEKIKGLEKEKDNLTGLFAGKKKKELESAIGKLKKEYDSMDVQAPEEVIRSILSEAINPVRLLAMGFGSFQYDDKKTPIKWIPLAKEDDRVLLITEMGIFAKSYNWAKDKVTWENCSLRKWLNNDFCNTAFTEEEKSRIITAKVKADKNPKYNSDPGKDTEDKIFLLSVHEAKEFFKTNEERTVKATPFAVRNGASVNEGKSPIFKEGIGNSQWWLRTPGPDNKSACAVGYDGSLMTYYVDYSGAVIRPAIWVRI